VIEAEKAKAEANDGLESNDDVESILVYGNNSDREEDEVRICTKRVVNDHFMNKLCPIENDVEKNDIIQPPIYPRHDDT